MTMTAVQQDELRACLANHPDRILFATACGPLLYGIPHQARYVDLRGVHLDTADGATRGWRAQRGSLQLEWQGHELGKFVRLLQVNNGSAYEQLFSPYVVHETEVLAELRGLAADMVSQQLFCHYRRQFQQMLLRFELQRERHVRCALYVARLALTGLHLQERGQILVDLPLLARFHERVAVLEMLEHLERTDPRLLMPELRALGRQLARQDAAASLPEQVPHREAAEAWLARTRERLQAS